MSSCFGNNLRLSLFGQSHGPAVGITIDGFPAGMQVDQEAVAFEMARRAPGRDAFSTARQEEDAPEILGGILNGVTTGQPISAMIRNSGQHSADYGAGVDLLRPGHADYTGHVRYHGFEDWRGGGHFSGRLTAPLVFAGALCRQYLAQQGISIGSHILQIAGVRDQEFPADAGGSFDALRRMRLPVLDPEAGEKMAEAIRNAREDGDSVGGVIECMACGLPAGLGAPFFDSAESVLSHLLFAIPAVKGVSFGAGFDFAALRGSEANDPFRMEGSRVITEGNHGGGLQGGITNGMPLVFSVCIRPTPSIGRPQPTVSIRRMENDTITVKGRHDPCIVPRAVPVVEAAAAIALMELWKERSQCL